VSRLNSLNFNFMKLITSFIQLNINSRVRDYIKDYIEMALDTSPGYNLLDFYRSQGIVQDVLFSKQRLDYYYSLCPAFRAIDIKKTATGERLFTSVSPENDAYIVLTTADDLFNKIIAFLRSKDQLLRYAFIQADEEYRPQSKQKNWPGQFRILHLEKIAVFSCWQMYFSPAFYQYIPESSFDAFDHCIENIVLPDSLRRITLYEDPFAYALPENRARQWAFRKELGIDQL